MSESDDSACEKDQFQLTLIERVFAHPILYDADHVDSRNIPKRDHIWAHIAVDLKVDEVFARNKWKNLRDGYIKYLKSKQLIESLPQEAQRGTRRRNYTKWYLAKKMACFKPFLSPVPSAKSPGNRRKKKRLLKRTDQAMVEVKIDHSNLSEANVTAEEGSEEESKPKKLKRKQSEPKFSSCKPPMASNGNHENQQSQNTKEDAAMDDIDYLMLGYAKTIKRFTPRGQASVKLKIAMLIHEQETKEL